MDKYLSDAMPGLQEVWKKMQEVWKKMQEVTLRRIIKSLDCLEYAPWFSYYTNWGEKANHWSALWMPTGGGLKHIGGIIGLFGGTRSNKRCLLWQNGPLSLAQDLEQNNNKDAYSGYLNEAWKTWCR
jgi:hypothetical protein